jgi:plasmid stability protein
LRSFYFLRSRKDSSSHQFSFEFRWRRFYNESISDLKEGERRMPVNLSIKSVPDDVAEELRLRAARNHRSLQGELLVILEESVARNRGLSPSELLGEIRSAGLRTPSESAQFIREERDANADR